MPTKVAHAKKISLSLILMALPVAIALLVLIYMLLNQEPTGSSSLACSSPAYQSVRTGMSKEDITSLLGVPESKRPKSSPDQNLFYQGENEAKISEGWVYNLSGSTNVEIYFDNAKRVNGKNCGQG